MTDIGNVAVTVGVNIGGFVAGMQQASESTGSFQKKLLDGSKALASYGAASMAAGAAIIAGIYKTSTDAVDAQDKMARSLGYTTESYQKLIYTTKAYGIEQEQLAGTMGELNIKIGEAIREGGDAAKAFTNLNLQAQDLAKMDATDRLATIADRLKALDYNSSLTSEALDKLGFTSEETWHLMVQGGDIFRNAAKEAVDYGYALNAIDNGKLRESKFQADKLGLAFEGIGNQISVALTPYVAEFNKTLRESVSEATGFRKNIQDAMKTAVEWTGYFANAIRGLQLLWAGMKLPVATVQAAVVTLAQVGARAVGALMDGVVLNINSVRDAMNKMLGTSYEMIALPTNSEFFEKIDLAADVARKQVSELTQELLELSSKGWPSDGVTKFLNDVAAASDKAAASITSKPGSATLAFSEDDKNNSSKADQQDQKNSNLTASLNAETESVRRELATRAQISKIYRDNEVAVNASYYQQQMAQIAASEQVKTAEAQARSQEDLARLAEKRKLDLESLAGNREAIAAVNAEYDQQELLAEQLKQQSLTAAQEEAQTARHRLREIEKQNAIDTALGLGQQLMSVTQGHSKRAFEFAKNAAIASATISGVHSAIDAWKSGMSVGGPWAPLFAAAYAGSSLLKTGAMIQSIRGTAFSGGGGGAGAAGGGSSSVPTPAGAGGGGGGAGPTAGPQSGNTQRVQFVGDFFSGATMETIAKGLLQYQKDGGNVVFDS